MVNWRKPVRGVEYFLHHSSASADLPAHVFGVSVSATRGKLSDDYRALVTLNQAICHAILDIRQLTRAMRDPVGNLEPSLPDGRGVRDRPGTLQMDERKYEKRPVRDGVWQVVYSSTGQVVTVDGNPLDDLEEREADEVIDLLDNGEIVPDPSDGP